MTDNLPTWLNIVLIAVCGLSALYKCYILPGYNKDKQEKEES